MLNRPPKIRDRPSGEPTLIDYSRPMRSRPAQIFEGNISVVNVPRHPHMTVLRFVLALSLCISASSGLAAETDLISRGAVIPWKHDVAQPERVLADFEEVRFRNSLGHNLRGWYFPSPQASHTILVCSGNTGNMSLALPYAQLLLDGGFNVLLFDYQGFGGSEGLASVTSLGADTEAAFQYLVQHKQATPKQIGVFGISLGSILALMIAREQEAAAVVVEDVFIPEQILERFGIRDDDPNVMKGMAIRMAKQLLLGRVDPIQNVKNFNGPVFLMHGLDDRLLPAHGTVQVADALTASDRVWLIDRAGHAPETLEVNDQEYRGQINLFFQQAFAVQLRSLKPKMTIQPRSVGQAKTSKFVSTSVEVTLDGDAALTSGPRPVQLVFFAHDVGRKVARVMMSVGERRRFRLPFRPEHVSAIEFQYVTPLAFDNKVSGWKSDSIDDHEWEPELSTFSKHRAELTEWTQAIFRRSDVAAWLMKNYGMNYSRASRYLKAYRNTDAERLLAFLEDNTNCPPSINARYARLLARLYCWPLPQGTPQTVQFKNDLQRVDVVEAMLPLIPDDKDNYFELGNASFQHRFTDAVIADALFRLARIRLRESKVKEARQLLRLHTQMLPNTLTTNLTESRIESISTVSDLDHRSQGKTNGKQ